MILFVFEGDKREVNLFRTMEHVFFSPEKKGEHIVCSFGNNIYALYNEMADKSGNIYSQDIVALLKQRGKLEEASLTSDIAEIYLFFDFDIHNKSKLENISHDEMIIRLKKLLDYFNNETENGKLYINYPMIESIRYTKKLPDLNYSDHVISLSQSIDFKKLADSFSYYKNLDFITFRFGSKGDITSSSLIREPQIKQNWRYIIEQNICKANGICSGSYKLTWGSQDLPQQKILEGEKMYVANNKISVLNSFPLFLLEYFGAALPSICV